MPLGGGNSSGAGSDAIKAGEAYVLITGRDQLTGVLDGVEKRLKGLGSFIQKSGLAIAGLGAGILTPLIAIFKESLDYGSGLQDAADRLDSTAEAAQRLSKAAEMSDTSLDAIVKANSLLTKAAIAAANGTEKQADAFKTLGIGAEEFLAMEADDRILAISRALDSISSPMEKSEFLMSLLGKSAVELAPLFKAGAEGIEGFYDAANKFLTANEDIQRAADTQDALDDVYKATKLTVLELGFAFLGLKDDIRSSADEAVSYLKMARDWIKDNREVIISVAALAAGMVALGVGVVGVGLVISSVGTIIGALSAVIGGTITAVITLVSGLASLAVGFVSTGFGVTLLIGLFTKLLAIVSTVITVALSPFVLKLVVIAAAIAGAAYAIEELTGLFSYLGTVITGVADDAQTSFTEISDIAKETVSGITAAIAKGDINLAWQIMLQGLKTAWMEVEVFLTKQWVKSKNFFVDTWKDAIYLAKLALNDYINWVSHNLDWTQTSESLLEEDKRHARIAKELGNDAVREDDARKKFRQKQLDDAQTLAEEQRRILRDLVAKANEAPEAGGPERAPMPRGMSSLSMSINQLGAAVRGAVGNRDIAGRLGIGPANTEAKKTNKNLEDIKKVLQNIEKKVEPDDFG